MKPLGIQGTIGSFVQFMKDIPDQFILDVNLTCATDAIITLQSSYMRQVLLEALSGVQSDTVEGVIHDPQYSGNVNIQFTSSYDCYLQKWVPVLIFGRTKNHYASHWKSLFNSNGDEVNESWNAFKNKFPGVTLDWSDALGTSFNEVLFGHATSALGQLSVQREDIHSYSRKCDVHFLQSVTHTAQKGNCVPAEKEGKFRDLVYKMTKQECSFETFHQVCQALKKEFPQTMPWLQWYLKPERAQCFFSACEHFKNEDMERFSQL